jgi:hypothetical protein
MSSKMAAKRLVNGLCGKTEIIFSKTDADVALCLALCWNRSRENFKLLPLCKYLFLSDLQADMSLCNYFESSIGYLEKGHEHGRP